MPKMISNIDKLSIAKLSLDYPPNAIAEEFDLNVNTVRAILECDDMQRFIKDLKDHRKLGFLHSERIEAGNYAYGLKAHANPLTESNDKNADGDQNK